ncbi:MAG TPA: AMP-binding protein, partial [Bacteroidia bacterium]|nr:AMP-binding protein [Bacteroidia bacterium]
MDARITSFEQYNQDYKRSVDDPESFWADIANNFTWRKKWDKVLEWDFKKPDVKWFAGGKLNITENCLDRHLEKRANQTAIIWEPNAPNGRARHITYHELHLEVSHFANVLKNLGAKKSDRICIYMPMVPEAVIAMLACARIGAIHSVVFAGFSGQSLADRINDCGCEIIITADGAYRGAKAIDLKKIVDEALDNCPTIRKSVILKHTGSAVTMKPDRDVWWHEEMEDALVGCDAEEMDAEDMLYILYTSGSTGKPKGVVHTTAGYMVYAWYSFINVFQYNEGEIYWCTA